MENNCNTDSQQLKATEKQIPKKDVVDMSKQVDEASKYTHESNINMDVVDGQNDSEDVVSQSVIFCKYLF